MPDFVIPPASPAAVPVEGGGLFPVRRIFCVGRNYAEHAREMGGDPDREPPFFFTKPADAVLTGGAPMPFPSETGSLHFELELVVALRSGGIDLPASEAGRHVFGYAVGLDMTRRDLQNAAKKAGRPWDMAKGFDHSAPIGAILPVADGAALPAGSRIALAVNGTARQDATLGDMIWPVPDVIASLSRLVRLEAGDLIFTGTPAGVGAVERGDALVGTIDGLPTLTVRIA